MNNRIGLGVFGTFGEPYGYQQAFYYDVSYTGSLDLNEAEIEFYPGTKLFAVRRELVDGVYTVCFCIYSYARELNTERFGTFIGTCIVLQDGYAEADYIYESLKSLHEHVMSNENNVDNNIIIAQKGQDVVLREPDEFVALKANVIPISKTPFFSSNVDLEKKYLVTPNPLSEDTKEAQVVNFFDKALKDYSDTETLYFSFDRNVYEFVSKTGGLEARDWDDFIDHQPAGAGTPVVRTKKGIHKTGYDFPNEDLDFPVGAMDQAPDTRTHEQPNPYQPKPPSYIDDTEPDEDDPYKPFKLWEEDVPAQGWKSKEVEVRMKEYNRLFKYTNTLFAHVNGETSGKGKRKQGSSEFASGGNNERKKRSALIIVIVLLALLFGSLAVYRFSSPVGVGKAVAASEITEDLSPASVQAQMPDTSEPYIEETPETRGTDAIKSTQTTTASVVAAAARESEKVTPSQPIPKVPVTGSGTTTGENTRSPLSSTTEQPKPEAPTAKADRPKASPLSFTGAGPKEDVSPRNPLEPKEPPLYLKSKDLRPRPNIEMSQNDIAMLRQSGVKNKTLDELTRLLFDNVPSNIGIIYKGQEVEYGAALLNSNRQAFQKSGSEYICTSDYLILHIPAYKSPRLPAVFPK